MNPANYRARILLDLFHTFLLPTLLLSLIFSIFNYTPGLFSIPLHLIFILAWVTSKGAYSESCHDREAKSLGAKPIPRVVGKWPGNIDILFTMMRAFPTSYVLDVYLQLFEEYQCTTLNLRIFWRDSVHTLFFFFLSKSTRVLIQALQIISMDQEHIKFLSSTGFQHFWRGRAQKERMSVLCFSSFFFFEFLLRTNKIFFRELFLGEGIFNRDDQVRKPSFFFFFNIYINVILTSSFFFFF